MIARYPRDAGSACPVLHPCVHALAARANFELPGPLPLRAFLVSSWRAFSGQLAAYTVCSVASRLHDPSWRSRGPLRAAAVRIGRAALEERRAIAFRQQKNWGGWKLAKFDT